MWNSSTEHIFIGNAEYFYMIDNQVRPAMMKYEEEVLLPKARIIKSCLGLDDKFEEYPIEGYYYKTPNLREYFTLIRNYQENEDVYTSINDGQELNHLKKITSSSLFGSEESTKWKKFGKPKPPLVRRMDIMTLCMDDKNVFPEYEGHTWSIPKILANLENYHTGNPNLVELAHLTGETECLVSGCETNALYREIAVISGSAIGWKKKIHWEVDEEVERMGKKIIDEYNKLIGANLIYPTIDNYKLLDMKPEIPRVAVLGYQIIGGEWYHWILDENRNVFDEYSVEMITTESYINKLKNE